MTEEDILQFVAITNCSVEEARFYLESSSGSLDDAVASFFANAEDGGAPVATQTAPSAAAAAPRMAPPPVLPRMVTDPSLRPQPAAAAAAPRAAAPSRPTGGPRIASLGDFNGGGDEGMDDSDDEEMNEYYAGGAKSGVAVQGRKEDRVGGLFDRARELGARDATGEDLERMRGAPRGGDGGGGAFSGAARKLGDPDAPVGGAGAESGAGAGAGAGAAPAKEAAEAEEGGGGDICHTITFFANGVFTVDDGPGRSVGDPANGRFIKALMEGVVPEELRPSNPSVHVDIHLVRNPSEYVEPAQPKYKAFTGSARTLGGPAAPEEAAGPSAAAAAAAPAPSAAPASGGTGGFEYSVNEDEPATSVQFRFWDGRKIVAKFNLTQTVGAVRRFLLTARPDLPASFSMKSMGFPPTPIADESKTVKEAGLENSVVVVSK